MFVVKYKNIFFAISAVLIIASFVSMFVYGFDFGIDFRGGTITQVSYSEGRPEQVVLASGLETLGIGGFTLQPTGTNGYVLRTRELTETEKSSVISALSPSEEFSATLEKYSSIGPVVGEELKKKAWTAIALVLVCIMLFITYVFRKVSEPVASWKYGLATVIALAHDVVIPTGIFVAYIHYTGGEIDILFVSALLSVLGYSVHDTIVVFDRVREHLRNNKTEGRKENFTDTVGKSVAETFGRSINTSLTIFIVLLVVFLIGGATTKDFTFVLLIGVVIGTYSSIFVASPLLVLFEKLQKKS